MGRLGQAEAAAHAELAVVDLGVVGAARPRESGRPCGPAPAWQPRQQKGQVEVSTPSGLPSHLETLSASAPVGQTDTQAPQNSQPASTCELPKAGPISGLAAAVLEREHRGAAHLVAHAHAAPAQDAEVVVAVVERVVVLGLEPPVGDRVVDVGDPDPLHHLLQLALAVVRAAAAAGRDARLADRRLVAPALLLLAADQAARGVLARG